MRTRWHTLGLLFALGATASLAAFLKLPGRTTQHVRIGPDEVYDAPRDDGFRMGPLRWDTKAYAQDPKLEPLRTFFRERCPDSRGLAAARCASDEFARAFLHGVPSKEFFEASYDPATDLGEHMAGAPGHCVTRSGLVAAILLANGIPARQLEIVAADLEGHNVVEVFDSHWALFDPTFGTIFETPAGPANARDALRLNTPGKWSNVGRPAQAAKPNDLAVEDIIYPDPWLYTRSGERAATWPLRILMVHSGAPIWRYGAAQELLRRVAVGLALASALCLLAPRWLRRRRRLPADGTIESITVARKTTEAHPAGPPGLEPRA